MVNIFDIHLVNNKIALYFLTYQTLVANPAKKQILNVALMLWKQVIIITDGM